MKFLCEVRLGALRPVDDAGQEALRRYGQGALVMVEAKKPRHGARHRLYWALMSAVHQNLPEQIAGRYPTVETLVSAFKMLAGVREQRELPDGTVYFIPGSISFAKMDEAEFARFLDQSIGIITSYFLPGVQDADLRREIEEMCGLRRHAA